MDVLIHIVWEFVPAADPNVIVLGKLIIIVPVLVTVPQPPVSVIV